MSFRTRINWWGHEPEGSNASCLNRSLWQNSLRLSRGNMSPPKKPSEALRRSWRTNTTNFPNRHSTWSDRLMKRSKKPKPCDSPKFKVQSFQETEGTKAILENKLLTVNCLISV